jgi:VCBS repeat-containing protein
VRLVLGRRIALAMVVALATASGWLVRAGTTAAVVSPAVDDIYTDAVEDTPYNVPAPGVLGNDATAVDPCAVVLDTTNLDGTVELDRSGSFAYTPTPNFNGETSFTYGMQATGSTPCTGEDGSATITITVAPRNDAPTATADSFIVLKNTTLVVGVPGVLINDDDIDGDTLTAVKVTNPAHGVVVLAADGSFSYTPASGYTGLDAFSYRAFDGTAQSPTRVVSLTVKAVPPVPTPTPIPTPTLAPTPTPEVTTEPSPSIEPSPSPSAEPSPSASVAPSSSPSATPGASPTPVPASDEGGVSLPVLLVIVLFVLLLGFGAALYVPKWLESQRGGPQDLD